MSVLQFHTCKNSLLNKNDRKAKHIFYITLLFLYIFMQKLFQ